MRKSCTLRYSILILTSLVVMTCLGAPAAWAHGEVGERIFPPTMTVDDPFAMDELALPTFSIFKNPAGDDGPAARQIDGGFEFTKEIFPHFAVGISDRYVSLKPDGGHRISGWDNMAVSFKYELWRNAPHEAIVSIGMDTDLGGTGAGRIADSFTTFTPTLYFGKGFGDFPDSLRMLKPLAVTGSFGQTFPTDSHAPNALELGLAIEYSLPYLTEHVKDAAVPAPLRDMIPLVELSFEVPENRAERGHTLGTINPGVLWEAGSFQLGVEAIIPANQATGHHVGALIQVQFFLDDLLPKVFGGPIFGG